MHFLNLLNNVNTDITVHLMIKTIKHVLEKERTIRDDRRILSSYGRFTNN